MEKSKISGNLYFLLIVVSLYVIVFVFDPVGCKDSLKITFGIVKIAVPILIIVIMFTALVDYFINPQKVAKYLSRESGVKGWAIATIAGTISHGPPFVWYPLIQDLREKGMSSGLAAVYFYNRAIKIPLIPMMVYYFGWKFFVVLTLFTIIASFIIWRAMDLING